MKDRLVEFPNRYRIVPVEGTSDLVDLLPVPGVVTDVGTPINKATLLQDDTAALYRLGPDAVVNDMFMALKMPAGYYGFKVTAKFSDGTPASNLELKGVVDFEGNTVVTDENGFAYAMASETSAVVDFSNYIGIVNKAVTLNVDTNQIYTPVEITVEKDTEMHLVTTSGVYRTYPTAIVDFCAVGGGGGGAGAQTGNEKAGGGGGGGYATNKLNQTSVGEVTFTIGAGGAGGTSSAGSYKGADGGQTTIKNASGTLATANGGSGSAGNDNGMANIAQAAGNGVGGTTYKAAGDGTVRVFGEADLPLPGGGGAGVGRYGGKDFGGNVAANGTGPGGGGGGYPKSTTAGPKAGSGYSGAVYYRARYE